MIFLAPGILITLRILFPALGIDRILMSESEYFQDVDFAPVEVASVRDSDLVDAIRGGGFSAVIFSLVSWQGVLRGVDGVREAIRSLTESRRPCSFSMLPMRVPLASPPWRKPRPISSLATLRSGSFPRPLKRGCHSVGCGTVRSFPSSRDSWGPSSAHSTPRIALRDCLAG